MKMPTSSSGTDSISATSRSFLNWVSRDINLDFSFSCYSLGSLYISNGSGKGMVNLGMIHTYIVPFIKEKFLRTYNW